MPAICSCRPWTRRALAQIRSLEAAGKFVDPCYEDLLTRPFYTDHILRMPLDQWPDPVKRALPKINRNIYVPMQWRSEMGASGKLAQWD
jgi:proline iminopeptidase